MYTYTYTNIYIYIYAARAHSARSWTCTSTPRPPPTSRRSRTASVGSALSFSMTCCVWICCSRLRPKLCVTKPSEKYLLPSLVTKPPNKS